MAEMTLSYADRIESVLLSEEVIGARVRELASDICRDRRGQDVLSMVVVLKGAFVFAADLGRAIHKAGGPEIRYDFVRASSYGTEVGSEGGTGRRVRLALVPDNLQGKDVLLVEDILDQGSTLARIREALLNECRARSVKLCVLLYKQLDAPAPEVSAVRASLVPDYVGFEIPDKWVAGYGLDAAEEFRDLPFVAAVHEEYYRNA